jgi:hypothetical protein
MYRERKKPADGIFTTAIPLSSYYLFTASDRTFDQVVRADAGNGFYSVTARFTITNNGIDGIKVGVATLPH